MVRKNIDGTEVTVNNAQEAYSKPEEIACFLPEKPIPESEVKDGLQAQEVRVEEEVKPVPKAGKRGK
jgi:hypothetical protein